MKVTGLFVSLTFGLLLSLSACAGHDSTPTLSAFATNDGSHRIVGGTDVTFDDAISRSIVALENHSAGSLCTGSLISEDLILTAAHCLNARPQEILIIFGLSTSDQAAKLRQAADMIVGPMWENRRWERLDTGDIALVRFNGGLPSGYQPIPLLEDPDLLIKSQQVILAGYGMSSGALRNGAGRLRKVEVSIENLHFSRSEILLNQTSDRGACHGDSGGPAYVQDGTRLLLWGVTSRGVMDPRNDCSKFSAYTNILPYTRWLKAAIRHLRDRALYEPLRASTSSATSAL